MQPLSAHGTAPCAVNEQTMRQTPALLRSMASMEQPKLPVDQRVALAAAMGQMHGNTSLQRAILVAHRPVDHGDGMTAQHIDHPVPRFRNVQHNRLASDRERREQPQRQPAQATQAVQRAALLAEDQIQAAIRYNNQNWRGEYRTQILVYLRGGPVGPAEQFTGEDVQKIANLQNTVKPDGVDGKIGDTTAASLLQAGLKMGDSAKLNPQQVRLIFYPGELENLDAWQALHQKSGGNWRDTAGKPIETPNGIGKLYVKVNGQLVAAYEARGGPPLQFVDDTHTADPTPAGDYRLGRQHAHTTRNWTFSQIPYGAALRWSNDGQNVQFRPSNEEHWSNATAVAGARSPLNQPLSVADLLDPADTIPGEHWANHLPKLYKRNDFGTHAWNLERSGARTAYYVHTTPVDEMNTEVGDNVLLETSHGCLHIKPADRDEMMKQGYLQAGVRFTVKSYRSHLLPDAQRSTSMPE